MSDDFFATAAPTAISAPTSWLPSASAASAVAAVAAPQPASSMTVNTSTLVGVGAAIAAALACLGAWAPWFTVSLMGVSADFGGLNSHLDGGYVMALGLVGVVLATVLATLPREATGRQAVIAGLVLIAIVGVAIVGYQYVHLTNTAARVSDLGGLAPPGFDLHAGAGWGLWLDGFAFTGLGLAAALGLFV
jgi:hypothetical protein